MKCINHTDAEAVTTCVSCRSSICDSCRVISEGKDYCKKCIAKNVKEQKRSPGLAALLSFIIAGAGQIYNGQIGKGLFILFTWWLILPWIYGIFDAYATAKKINEGKIAPRSLTGCAIVVIVVVVLMIFCMVIVGLLTAIAIPGFMKARERVGTNACVANLKNIEDAKRLWAIDTGAAKDVTLTWADLVSIYLVEKPTCPKGGTYTIGSVDSPATCSIGDNNTDWTISDDHVINLGDTFQIAPSLGTKTNIYTSPYFNFTISYPLDWESKEISGIVAFLSPREGADDFSENVNVVIEDISNYPMALEDYVDLGFKNWQNVNKNIKLLKKSKTQIDDKDAFYIICDDGDLKYKQYIFIYNLKAYVLTYTGKKENFDKYLNQAEAIMQSIKISL